MLLESFQMFPIFLSNKKCRLEHVVNNLTSCLITEFLWIFSYKPHGIQSNSMDTLWHSMELHRYFREPHGIPWTYKETPWNFMAFHGTPSLPHGTPWNSMAFHGTPWILPGTPWHSTELHWYSMDVPWNSMDFHRFPWNSMRYFTQVLTVSSNEKCQLFYGWTRSSGMQNPHLFPLLPPHPE